MLLEYKFKYINDDDDDDDDDDELYSIRHWADVLPGEVCCGHHRGVDFGPDLSFWESKGDGPQRLLPEPRTVMLQSSQVKSSQVKSSTVVVGLRDRVAIIRALLHCMRHTSCNLLYSVDIQTQTYCRYA